MVPDGAYPVFGANGIIGRYDQYNHEEPQLLITCRGATCGSVNISERFSWITGNAMVVRPKNAEIDMRFLEYLFRGGIDISKAITGAAQPQITRSNLSPLQISYPTSPTEQQRIVAILDEAFAGIATARAYAEQNLQNARALFESQLQAVFSQQGEGWMETTVRGLVSNGSLAKPQDGNHGEIHPTKADYVEAGVPFVMAADLANGAVDTHGCRFISEQRARTLRIGFAVDGDVLLSHKGTIGRVAILQTDMEFVMLTPQVTYYRVIDQSVLLNRYLYFYFQSPRFMNQMAHIANAGSTRAYIGITRQMELEMLVPPIDAQYNLVSQLEELQAESRLLESIYERKLSALHELRQSLMHQAFSGNL